MYTVTCMWYIFFHTNKCTTVRVTYLWAVISIMDHLVINITTRVELVSEPTHVDGCQHQLQIRWPKSWIKTHPVNAGYKVKIVGTRASEVACTKNAVTRGSNEDWPKEISVHRDIHAQLIRHGIAKFAVRETAAHTLSTPWQCRRAIPFWLHGTTREK